MDDFVIRALFAGLGIALVAGPLGSFMVWRKMAYFGDTLAHSALLGTGLSLAFQFSTAIGTIVTCLAIAFCLALLQRQKNIANDTLLGILSHGALALGLVIVSLSDVRINVMGLLFGDILAVDYMDILVVYSGVGIIGVVLIWLWNPLISATVHEELAHVEGVRVNTVRIVFMMVLALVVAVAMKIIGILLVTSLLIIPAAAVRGIARSPEQMAAFAAVVASMAVGGGLWLSFTFDTPAGPSIVVAALFLFIIGITIKR